MTTEIEYALMAGASYISTRAEINRFPAPSGWSEKVDKRESQPSGFEATYFINGPDLASSTEIVISYAGTDPSDYAGDWPANLALASGAAFSDQLAQAADYYLAVKGSAPSGAKISFTGHSLGGGLAALMAVMFGESAVTFDQAPFLQSARLFATTDILGNPVITGNVQRLRDYLTDHASGEQLAKLDAYIAANTPDNPTPVLADTLSVRSRRVANINVQGEVLTTWPATAARIGTSHDIANSGNIGGIDLHSQALLAAFLQSRQSAADGQALNDVTFTLPDLLKMIFDKNLFAFDTGTKNTINENFLERLVKHEAGIQGSLSADAMVTRFTKDLRKLASDAGLSVAGADLTKALIAFAMQAYYSGRIATDAGKQLFETISGGIHFDRSDISNDPDLNKIKGHVQYFQNHLATLPATEQAIINQSLPNLLDWYLAGTRMTAAAQDKTAFMLGAAERDNLAGGTQNDLLVGLGGADLLSGNGGADILIGGTGSDILFGGAGADTYAFTGGDGEDLIADWSEDGRGGDGQGRIVADGQDVQGAFALDAGSRSRWRKDGWTASFVGEIGERGMLILSKEGGSDRIVLPQWLDGELGITLEAPAAIAYTDLYGTEGDDRSGMLDEAGNPILASTAPNQALWGLAGSDVIELTQVGNIGDGGIGNDVIRGNGGGQRLYGEGDNDVLVASFAGDDILDGGTGDDALQGGEGDDRLEGGDGMDFIDGGQGSDHIRGGIGADFILGGGSMVVELSSSDGSYEDFADGKIAMLRSNGAGNFALPERLAGWSNVEGDAADWIDAGEGDDLVLSGDGADTVMGGAGKDTLIGQSGGDWLQGGTAANDGQWRVAA